MKAIGYGILAFVISTFAFGILHAASGLKATKDHISTGIFWSILVALAVILITW